MSVLLALLRLVGRLFLTAADEMARVGEMQGLQVPDVMPDWMDEEADL